MDDPILQRARLLISAANAIDSKLQSFSPQKGTDHPTTTLSPRRGSTKNEDNASPTKPVRVKSAALEGRPANAIKCAVITGSSLVNTTSDIRLQLKAGSIVIIDGIECQISESTSEWSASTVALQHDWTEATNFDAWLEITSIKPKRSPAKNKSKRINTAVAVPASDIHAAVSQLDSMLVGLEPPMVHTLAGIRERNDRNRQENTGERSHSNPRGAGSKLPVLRRLSKLEDQPRVSTGRKMVNFDENMLNSARTSERMPSSRHHNNSNTMPPVLAEITRELKAMRITMHGGQGVDYEIEQHRQLALYRIANKMKEDQKKAQEEKSTQDMVKVCSTHPLRPKSQLLLSVHCYLLTHRLITQHHTNTRSYRSKYGKSQIEKLQYCTRKLWNEWPC